MLEILKRCSLFILRVFDFTKKVESQQWGQSAGRTQKE